MQKEFIVNFYTNYKLYIFPAVVALSSLFLIIFAIYPQTKNLIENQKTVGELNQKSQFLNNKVSALESYDEEDLSQKAQFVLNALPVDRDLGNTLGLLQYVVAQSGFSINSINFGSAGGKVDNAESFEVKLEVKGTKALLQTLLNNLESSPRLIKIKNFDISSNQNAQSVDVSLVLEILYLQLPKSFGAVDSPITQLTQKDEAMISSLEQAIKLVPATSARSSKGKANPFE